MPRAELSVLLNSRNDEQTERERAAWIAWVDTQKSVPKTRREAWYGYSTYRKGNQ